MVVTDSRGVALRLRRITLPRADILCPFGAEPPGVMPNG